MLLKTRREKIRARAFQFLFESSLVPKCCEHRHEKLVHGEKDEQRIISNRF